MMVNHLMAIVATAGMTSLPKDALDAGAKRAAFVRQLLPVSRDSLYLAQYDGYKEALAAHYAKEPQSRKVAKAELVSEWVHWTCACSTICLCHADLRTQL